MVILTQKGDCTVMFEAHESLTIGPKGTELGELAGRLSPFKVSPRDVRAYCFVVKQEATTKKISKRH